MTPTPLLGHLGVHQVNKPDSLIIPQLGGFQHAEHDDIIFSIRAMYDPEIQDGDWRQSCCIVI